MSRSEGAHLYDDRVKHLAKQPYAPAGVYFARRVGVLGIMDASLLDRLLRHDIFPHSSLSHPQDIKGRDAAAAAGSCKPRHETINWSHELQLSFTNTDICQHSAAS